MLATTSADLLDNNTYTLTYNEAEWWLGVAWRGFVNAVDAQRGAEAYLQFASQHPSPYLLNDNSQLQGPWFESLDWLRDVWMPHATRLGLRYVAHVVQANKHHDVLLLSGVCQLPVDLQIFREVEDAQAWLQHMRSGE